jgi:hypothetical protein
MTYVVIIHYVDENGGIRLTGAAAVDVEADDPEQAVEQAIDILAETTHWDEIIGTEVREI